MQLFDITPTPSLFVYNTITPSLCLVYPLVCWCQTTTPHQDYSTWLTGSRQLTATRLDWDDIDSDFDSLDSDLRLRLSRLKGRYRQTPRHRHPHHWQCTIIATTNMFVSKPAALPPKSQSILERKKTVQQRWYVIIYCN